MNSRERDAMIQLGDSQSTLGARDVVKDNVLSNLNLRHWQTEFDSYMQAQLAHEFAEDRELDDQQFAVDHFERRLFPIIDTLHTKCARRMGQQRRQVMVGFLEQLKAEVS